MNFFSYKNEFGVNDDRACHHKYNTRLIYRPAWAPNWDSNEFYNSMIYRQAELSTETLSPKGIGGK